MSSLRTVCAKSEAGSGPCFGDSGSSFVIKVGRNWFVRAITSASLLNYDGSCDVTKHAVYTNLLLFHGWIIEKTGIAHTEDAHPLKIISREDWNAMPPGPDIIYLKPPNKRIMIAHTVTSECENLAECISIMQSIQRNQRQTPTPGFNDIYCNFFIGGDGLILEGRGWKVRGEHTIGATRSHNDAICISFIGNFQDLAPKQSQIDAMWKLLTDGIRTHMLDSDYVINAQRDFYWGPSPGDAFYSLVKTWPRFQSSLKAEV